MLCLRCSVRGASSVARVIAMPKVTPSVNVTRSISLLTPRRPVLPTQTPRAIQSSIITEPTSATVASAETLDLMPKVSSHPALATMQVRCGPRRTFNPSHFVRKRRHGFLARNRSKKGRKILTRRRLKGRSTLSH